MMPGLKDKIIPPDRAIIEQIEEQIGVQLTPRSLGEIMFVSKNGYALDKKGQVKGVNLDNTKIKDILFLSDLDGLTHLALIIKPSNLARKWQDF
jgi:hypothetical protein